MAELPQNRPNLAFRPFHPSDDLVFQQDRLVIRLPSLNRILLVAVLLLGSKAFVPLLGGGGAAENIQDESSPLNRLLWLGIYAAVGVGVLAKSSTVLPLIARVPLIGSLNLLVLASSVWSDNPTLTMERALAFGACTVIGIYLAATVLPEELLSALKWTTLFVTLACLLAVIVTPEQSLDIHGNWTGVFSHKNRLGIAMGLGSILWTSQLVYRKRQRALAFAMLGLTFLLLVNSNSQTSLVLSLAGVVLVFASPFVARSGKTTLGLVTIMSFLLSLPAVTLLANRFDSLTDRLGRDTTLSGRTDIWAAVWPKVWEQPWVGYGYESFWHGRTSVLTDVTLELDGFLPFNAHNGYLDTALAIGLIGSLMLVCLLASVIVRSFKYLRHNANEATVFNFSLLMFLVFYNTVESNILEFNSVWWILIVYFTAYTATDYTTSSQKRTSQQSRTAFRSTTKPSTTSA